MAADHYGVLGLSNRATAEEVKKAYRTLSKLYHPDKAGPHADEAAKREREQHMVMLNAAYQVLMSPRQRQGFDLSQPAAAEAAAAGTAGTTGAFSARRHASHGPTFAHHTPHRGNRWNRPPSAPPRPAEQTTPAAPASPAPAPVSAGGHRPGASAPRPRYQLSAKYTARSRHARRMDPAMYTTHIPAPDGRGPDCAAAEVAAEAATAESPLAGLSLPEVRPPSYLQKQLDQAKEWERLYVPAAPPDEEYQWSRASNHILKGVRERRQQRTEGVGGE